VYSLQIQTYVIICLYSVRNYSTLAMLYDCQSGVIFFLTLSVVYFSNKEGVSGAASTVVSGLPN
jgi:hypothetical protein